MNLPARLGMPRFLPALLALSILPQLVPTRVEASDCGEPRAGASERELRCRYGALGAGRFGLLSYMDVPVYQPATPMPGTHVVGVRGHAAPRVGESYEAWEWRVLRESYGPEARQTYDAIEMLDPEVAARIRHLEQMMREAGVPVRRLESWRSPVRQAFLFQQGRSRPGQLATGTLTSLHSLVDSLGRPAARAVDYAVPRAKMQIFHELVLQASLESFGAGSNDEGHVFLRERGLPESELSLLRVLPRVPEVTLATGRPVGEMLPAGGAAVLRRASEDFARDAFIARPAATLALGRPRGRMVAAAEKPPLARVCVLSERGSPQAPSAARGAPCGPPGSGSLSASESLRRTDE